MVSEVSDGWAKRMIAADIVPVSAELADGDGGYRTVWLMPATLRDFLEQRRTAEYPFA